MPKEKEELDRLLNTPSEDEEEIDEDEEKNSEEETNENKEEIKEEKDEKGEENEEEDGEEEDEASKKDRWHGKSREEVIKAHEDLEKKNQELEEKFKGEESGEEEEKEEEKEEEEGIEIPADEEMAKMTPRKFAMWILERIDEKVSKTYEEKSAARDAVTKEIKDAQRDHPLLKTNPEYRELVLAVIDASASKGKAMPLKEACQKVDAFTGKEKGEEEISDKEKNRLKKAKAQVESGAGASSSPIKESSKETKRIQKALEPSSSDSPLGGLGV